MLWVGRLRGLWIVGFASVGVAQVGCTSLATSALADALSGTGGLYAQDDDPELVADAVPFGLKTMEGVLEQQPEHIELLTALSSGFTQYAYAFLSEEADAIEDVDYARAERLKARSKRLYLRARKYGLMGLDVRHEGLSAALKSGRLDVLSRLQKDDVPLAYWTAAAWALYVSSSGLDPDVIVDLPAVRGLVDRGMALDAAYGDGAFHEVVLSLETAVPGGSLERAEAHYQQAVEMSGGRRAGTFVAYAERICVKLQDRACFDKALDRALAIDVDAHPNDRLANIIMQRRARRLKAQAEDLFVMTDAEGSSPLAQAVAESAGESK